MTPAKKYQQFDAWLVNVVSLMQTDYARLGFTFQQAEALLVLYNEWTGWYCQYIDDAARTAATTASLRAVMKKLDAMLRAFRMQIKTDRAHAFTARDFVTFKLPARA